MPLGRYSRKRRKYCRSSNGNQFRYHQAGQTEVMAAYRAEHEADGCEGCGRTGLRKYVVHHIVPRQAGGLDHPSNYLYVCLKCHGLIEGAYVRLRGYPCKKPSDEEYRQTATEVVSRLKARFLQEKTAILTVTKTVCAPAN